MIKLESGNYCTVEECAEKLGVSRQHVAKLCRLNKLKSIKLQTGITSRYYILDISLSLYRPNKKTRAKMTSKERFKEWYEKNKESYNAKRRQRAKLTTL